MTDREYLEMAAKAAGYVLGKHTQKDWAFTYGGVEWNPITDDGDALRLAVKLNIDAGKPGMRLRIDWRSWDDPYAATRRAIVRAAAEIGRSMK